MVTKSIQKSVSFDNIDEFVTAVKSLSERKSVKNFNFSGNVQTDEKTEKKSARFNIGWQENESI